MPVLIVFGIIVLYFLSSIRILKEYERAVIFRLGKLTKRAKGPGICFVWTGIDKMVRVSLRVITADIPPQNVITRDNVSVNVNAVLYFRVLDAQKAIVEVEAYRHATFQFAQTTLRSILGQADFDQLLSEREHLNTRIQEVIDQYTDPWGIKVTTVEIKDVDLPETMMRAMARQAEAEREKRAKIIHAEGEFLASKRLTEAAHIMSQNPVTLQLRYLETVTEIAAEKSSTILFPLPLDLIKGFFLQNQPDQDKESAPDA